MCVACADGPGPVRARRWPRREPGKQLSTSDALADLPSGSCFIPPRSDICTAVVGVDFLLCGRGHCPPGCSAASPRRGPRPADPQGLWGPLHAGAGLVLWAPRALPTLDLRPRRPPRPRPLQPVSRRGMVLGPSSLANARHAAPPCLRASLPCPLPGSGAGSSFALQHPPAQDVCTLTAPRPGSCCACSGTARAATSSRRGGSPSADEPA